MRIRLEDFVAETFRPYLGTSFSFRLPKQPWPVVRLKLQEVRAASAPSDPEILPGAVRRGGFFSLLFVGDAETAPVSGLYQLDHPDFEPAALLLSRVSVSGRRPDDPPLLEAVFG